jgi:hypothetical protein
MSIKKLITKYLIEFELETTDRMVGNVEELWQKVSEMQSFG